MVTYVYFFLQSENTFTSPHILSSRLVVHYAKRKTSLGMEYSGGLIEAA